MDPGISQNLMIIDDTIPVFGKNARINTEERLIVFLSELSLVRWDIVCFAGTRTSSSDDTIDGGNGLICHFLHMELQF